MLADILIQTYKVLRNKDLSELLRALLLQMFGYSIISKQST
jgi:hypothetical protein